MHFTIEGEHKKFFQTQNYIEFDNLLTPEESSGFLDSCNLFLKNQIENKVTSLIGRDIFRSASDIKSKTKRFAQILYALSNVKPIRLIYDHIISPISLSVYPCGNHSLEEISSLQTELYGLLLALEVNDTLPPPFPQKRGNGVFFKGILPFSFDPLYNATSGCYLLVVFSGNAAIVVEKKSDPLFFSFKRLGYSIGDHLQNESHPIVYR